METTVPSEAYDVFISYSRADTRHAAEIDSVLRAQGLKAFFDRRNLTPGLPWVRALEQAIGAAKAVIVLIGPGGFGNTQQYERELAIVRQSRDPAFPVVPVILRETRTDRPFGSASSFLATSARVNKGQFDIFQRARPRQKCRHLEDETNIFAPDGRACVFVQLATSRPSSIFAAVRSRSPMTCAPLAKMQ